MEGKINLSFIKQFYSLAKRFSDDDFFCAWVSRVGVKKWGKFVMKMFWSGSDINNALQSSIILTGNGYLS